jgi:muconolactone delta-isomerase
MAAGTPNGPWKAPQMEYLVTMTTNVPGGTSDQEVADVRARETAHSRELARQGYLLRLWRPPLRPGEWRSLGLFGAADDTKLEEVLASMPLRVWRTDEVTALAPHPNDPGLAARLGAAEFLTWFTVAVPAGTADQAVADAEAAEARQAKELAGQGHLLRLWRLPGEPLPGEPLPGEPLPGEPLPGEPLPGEPLPGESRALGLWRARDLAEMRAILQSLPLDAWMMVQTTPLTPHPSDPALTAPGADDRASGGEG